MDGAKKFVGSPKLKPPVGAGFLVTTEAWLPEQELTNIRGHMRTSGPTETSTHVGGRGIGAWSPHSFCPVGWCSFQTRLAPLTR